jgi:hypothetical protein
MNVPQLKPVHDVPEIDLDDIDKLLESLSPEELEELNGDFDPDVSFTYHAKYQGYPLKSC